VNFQRRFGRFSNGFTPSFLKPYVAFIWLRKDGVKDIEKIPKDPRKGAAGWLYR
jgi:hypothetical protein